VFSETDGLLSVPIAFAIDAALFPEDHGRMSRAPLLTIFCLLLSVLACGAPPDQGAAKQADKQAAAKQADKQAAAKTESPPPTPVEPTPTPEPTPEPTPDEPTTAIDPAVDTPPEPDEPDEPTPGGWQPPAGADIRSDAVIPPGTPADNAAAFKQLPAAKTDGPPVGGIGTNGIHFDSMVVGRGWEKSRCVEPTTTFDPAVDDRVNICLRVVHPGDVEEQLTVEWVKVSSKSVRRSTITVKAMHAYLTRSYLPIKSNYTGSWTATIKTADEVVLGQVSFEIE